MDLAIQILRFTEIKTGYVQNVCSRVRQDKLHQLLKLRFVNKDGKPGHQGNPSAEWGADYPAVEDLLQFPDLSLPAPVFVDEIRYSRFAARPEVLLRNCQGGSHGLLADNRDLVGRSQLY